METPGVNIGPYQVVGELGRGGMGVVYEVRHPDMPRSLALKRLRADQALPEDVLRFQQEAELLARVRHPNVLTIHQLDRDAEGLYLVTDLVEGESLKTIVKRGPLEPERAVEILIALAGAVAAIQAEGILHRDLKPENVIIGPDGVPVLLDFGLARDAKATQRLTQTGTVMGTPTYMSPEQAGGSVDPDARTDVYGLGAILFALLVGRAPFAGNMISVIHQVLNTEPSWECEAPADLIAIGRKAMAKDRDERHPTAVELREDLERLTGGSAPERHGEWTLAIAGLVLLGALVAGALLLAGRSNPAESTIEPEDTTSTPKPEDAPLRNPPLDSLEPGAQRVAAFRRVASQDTEAARLLLSRARRARLPLARLDSGAGWPRLCGHFADDRAVLVHSGQWAQVHRFDLDSWSWSTPRRTWSVPPSKGDRGVRSLVVNRAGRELFLGCDDENVYQADLAKSGVHKIWKPPPGVRLVKGETHTKISALALADRELAVGGNWLRPFRLRMDTGHQPLMNVGLSWVYSLGYSRTGRYLAVARDHHVRVWEGLEVALERKDPVRYRPRALAWHPKYDRFAVGWRNGSIDLFDMDREVGMRVATLRRPGVVWGVAFSRSGDRLHSLHSPVNSPEPSSLCVWDVSRFEADLLQVPEQAVQVPWTNSLELSPDGRLLVLGGMGEVVIRAAWP